MTHSKKIDGAVRLRRRTVLGAALPLLMGLGGTVRAQELSALEKIRASGILKVALYKDNAPYSNGPASSFRGVDVSLAQALAKQMGLTASFLPFDAGETMGDDLRNMVWKGHYMGYGPADVMLHVPLDTYFMGQNPQCFIFGPYAREHLVVLHNPKRLESVYNPEDLSGKKVGVEQGSGAASALLGYKSGMLSNQISIYTNGMDAASAVVEGKIDAAFVSLAQAEAVLFAAGQARADWAFSELVLPGVPPHGWPLGMAVKSANKDLAKLLDDALTALRENGELVKLFQSQGLTLAAP